MLCRQSHGGKLTIESPEGERRELQTESAFLSTKSAPLFRNRDARKERGYEEKR